MQPRLDQRITVYAQNVTGQSASGADVLGSPTEVCSAWAEVLHLEGRELDRAMQRWAEARYQITIRRRSDVTLKREHSITWGDSTLDVLDIRGPGTREPYWVLIAKDHAE